jgi:Domain of unknown function (DUF5122) beta-propeller
VNISRVAAAAATAAACLIAGLPGLADAQLPAHPSVVSDDPSNLTPHLAEDGTGVRPRVLALGRHGDTMYVGGMFHNIQDRQRQSTVPRENLFAFDVPTGDISAFAPNVNGPVWAIAVVGDSIYVGGDFTSVNGVARRGLAKLDVATGAVDPTFVPPFGTGRVTDLAYVDGRLIVAGSFPKRLVALRPTDGRGTTYITAAIAGSVPLTNEKTNVFRFAVDPDEEHLVAVGNFTSVDGAQRVRAFMLDMGATAATLSPWWYPPFADKCETNTASRQSYLEDVDFSPDGSYFVFASTGFVTDRSDQIGTHVCDAAARFETDVMSPSQPTWINYTGGDTLHSVVATGAAVYVQGHSRWLDNPLGRDSAGPGAVSRPGGGAIDPTTGDALSWNPVMSNTVGGFAFLAAPDGLWIGRDGNRIGGEYHRGLAFMPLT